MDAIPTVMRAIDPEQPGGPEVLRIVDRPVPTPGEGEVLIRVAAAGINRPEVLQRMGAYPPPPGAPSIPGLEVSGTIVATGAGVERDLIGQPVCALIAGGGYAEYAVAPYGQCLPVPEALTMVEAAAMPETLFTVWTNLFERGFAAEGDTVLVHGGTSGIGTMAIALCNLFGVDIIVTAGSDEKCAAAKSAGADHAINYKTQDFADEVKRITAKAGVDVILDMVAGAYVEREVACLAPDGRLVIIAVQGGTDAKVDAGLVLRNRLTITGSTLRPRPVAFKSAIAAALKGTVWPWLEQGTVKPVIHEVFPAAEASRAHALMETNAHIGKLVLQW